MTGPRAGRGGQADQIGPEVLGLDPELRREPAEAALRRSSAAAGVIAIRIRFAGARPISMLDGSLIASFTDHS